MPSLRAQAGVSASGPVSTPYPSWSRIADGIGCSTTPPQDTQAMKEARIWRALAEEASPDEQNDVSRPPRGNPGPKP